MPKEIVVVSEQDADSDWNDWFTRHPRLLSARLTDAQRLALLDPESHLYNRDFILNLLQYEMERGKRYNRSVAIAVICFEKPKTQAEKGTVGRAAVQALADALQTAVRVVDHVGRLTTDRMAIIMPETNVVEAAATAKRIRERIRLSVQIQQLTGKEFESLKIGIATFPDNANEHDELLARAVEALQ